MSDSPLSTARASARAWWAGLGNRERRLLAVGAAVLAAFLLWTLAVAPALRTLRTAPAQLAAAEAQVQRMQALAAEAAGLRAVAPVPMAQAQAALTAATGRLGEAARLSLQGERAVVTLKGIGSDQLAAWLGEARAGARARVVEASLRQAGPGRYDGSLTLALGAAR
ncbi:MAG TPA: type II secretion system protein GspM [Aquabacterium sp.]|nr:type II secretion system protein GspM [Aquabacterium sp.]HQC97860.1 type II secretion system protein GspM [Aquabacterium sp.]